MDNYIKYNYNEIRHLNKTNLWSRTPIEVKERSFTNVQKYILHATGDCDLNGRKYIALPTNCNHNDPEIKKNTI